MQRHRHRDWEDRDHGRGGRPGARAGNGWPWSSRRRPVTAGDRPGAPGLGRAPGDRRGGRADRAGDPHELARFPDPLSPEAAARVSGLPPLDLADAADYIGKLAASRDLVLVEGAGGLLVRYDAAGATLADLAAMCAPRSWSWRRGPRHPEPHRADPGGAGRPQARPGRRGGGQLACRSRPGRPVQPGRPARAGRRPAGRRAPGRSRPAGPGPVPGRGPEVDGAGVGRNVPPLTISNQGLALRGSTAQHWLTSVPCVTPARRPRSHWGDQRCHGQREPPQRPGGREALTLRGNDGPAPTAGAAPAQRGDRGRPAPGRGDRRVLGADLRPRSAPRLGDFPFFYWFQLIWMPVVMAALLPGLPAAADPEDRAGRPRASALTSQGRRDEPTSTRPP